MKTWLITALVNFHAMRGDMADEARDSISSEEVKALASNLKNVEVKSFQQHLTLEKSYQAGDSWSLGQRDASCDQREPCPFQRGHCNTGAEGIFEND